ncbi:MAG: glycosyltransferase [Phenylobacterium sp.]
MTGTCVLVSPHFPPSTLAGVHRARHLAKHLPAAGWTPTVICVDESFHEERLDPGLSALVPDSLEIVRARAISARWTRPIGLGDISIRALPSIRRELHRIFAERPVDVCFITGSPYYQMVLSGEIARRFGVPVVLDFQDPWVSAWGAAQPRLSKSGLSHALAVALEPTALRGATHITTVSEIQNAQLRQRYPWLDERRMSAHPIGADPEDFAALGGAPLGAANLVLDRSKINLSYVGNVWPGAMQPLRVFLEAVKRLALSRPDLTSRLQINFVGTSNQPNEFERLSVMPAAKAAGVETLVREIPQRVPYLEALSVLKSSDGLLMIGSNEPHYTASKIYPNLMSGRPYLSLFHRDSSAHAILEAAGGGVALAFSTLDELEALQVAIRDGLERLLERPESLGRPDEAAYRPYEAASIARQYGEIFDRLKAERGRAA